MTKYILLVFCLLFHFIEIRGEESESLKFEHITLENKFLKLQFLPASMGRLSRLELKSKGINLLREYEAIRTSRSPLFCPISDNSAGIRELYWGKGIMGSTAPIKIVSRSGNKLSLFAKHYANDGYSLKRIISIIPNNMIIQVSTSIHNNSPHKTELAVWLNVIPSVTFGNVPLIPAKGGINIINKRKVFYSRDDSIISGYPGSSYVAPARPWLATAYPESKVVMALVFSKEQLYPDGFFHTWQGNSWGKNIRTIEAVMANRKMNPDSPLELNYKIMVFKGINSIKEISNSCGIEAKIIRYGKKYRLFLTICPAAPVPAGKLSICLRSNKHKIFLNSVKIKELQPGQIQKLSFTINDRNMAPGKYQIAGKWSNNIEFILINPTLIIKK